MKQCPQLSARAFFCASSTEFRVVAGPAHQGGPARLAERDAEFHLGHRLHDRLVQVFDRLDEVRLAEDEVDVGRLVDRDGGQFHGNLLLVAFSAASCPSRPCRSLRAPQHVPLHRLLHIGLLRRAQVAERRIQRVELEEVAVPAHRRAGAAVAGALPVVAALARAGGQRAAAFGQRGRAGRQVVPLCLADNPGREITASGSLVLALAAVGVRTGCDAGHHRRHRHRRVPRHRHAPSVVEWHGAAPCLDRGAGVTGALSMALGSCMSPLIRPHKRASFPGSSGRCLRPKAHGAGRGAAGAGCRPSADSVRRHRQPWATPRRCRVGGFSQPGDGGRPCSCPRSVGRRQGRRPSGTRSNTRYRLIAGLRKYSHDNGTLRELTSPGRREIQPGDAQGKAQVCLRGAAPENQISK